MTFVAGARSLAAAARVVVAAVVTVVVTVVVTLVVSLVIALVGAAASGTTAAANPVISSVAPDPSVARGADGAFHVYATSDDWADGAGHRLVPHFRSFDLVEWEYVGDAFATRPSWAPLISFLWAPDVHVRPGGVDGPGGAVMYYTTGGAEPCIGRATAPGIEGPWSHDPAPVVCYGDYRGELLDPMDPEVVFTDDGPVMLMGNFEGIHAVPMNAAGTELDGDPVRVAGTGVEAPAVVTRDGSTHLFTSANLCCNGEISRYHVLGGRADDLMGPYETRTGGSLLDRLAGDVILEGDDDWVGPGHVDVVTDDAGQDWMIYHAAPRGAAVLPNGVQRRYMLLDRLDWVTVEGARGTWPVVGDGTPSSSRAADPVVALPVRLTAEGEVTLRDDDDGNGGDGSVGGVGGNGSSGGEGGSSGAVLDLAVRVESTGAPYSGELTAAITGPSKQRHPLQFLGGGDSYGAQARDGGRAQSDAETVSVSVSVPAGGALSLPLSLRSEGPLTPGRYELVVAIGPGGGAGAQELAVFGLEVAGDGSLSLGSGALGSSSLGSVGKS